MKNNNYIQQSDDQFLRIGHVAELTTLSKSCINLWVAQGKFPKPITLSNTVKVWRFKEIRGWAEEQLAKSEDGGSHAN
jgi:prophage regulatory protein